MNALKYPIILLDADNTVMDFDDAEHQALVKVFSDYRLTLTPSVEQIYQTVNQNLWREFEQNNNSFFLPDLLCCLNSLALPELILLNLIGNICSVWEKATNRCRRLRRFAATYVRWDVGSTSLPTAFPAPSTADFLPVRWLLTFLTFLFRRMPGFKNREKNILIMYLPVSLILTLKRL